MALQTKKYSPNLAHARRRSRERALQAMYQWDINCEPAKIIIQQFIETQDMSKADTEYFEQLVMASVKNIGQLDERIKSHSSIPIAQIDPIERAILRVAVYELFYCFEVPYRVVINEAVELAKRYGGEEGHKFINGVLDKAARDIRKMEISK